MLDTALYRLVRRPVPTRIDGRIQRAIGLPRFIFHFDFREAQAHLIRRRLAGRHIARGLVGRHGDIGKSPFEKFRRSLAERRTVKRAFLMCIPFAQAKNSFREALLMRMEK